MVISVKVPDDCLETVRRVKEKLERGEKPSFLEVARARICVALESYRAMDTLDEGSHTA